MNTEFEKIVEGFVDSLNDSEYEEWQTTERNLGIRVLNWFSDYLYKNNIDLVVKK